VTEAANLSGAFFPGVAVGRCAEPKPSEEQWTTVSKKHEVKTEKGNHHTGMATSSRRGRGGAEVGRRGGAGASLFPTLLHRSVGESKGSRGSGTRPSGGVGAIVRSRGVGWFRRFHIVGLGRGTSCFDMILTSLRYCAGGMTDKMKGMSLGNGSGARGRSAPPGGRGGGAAGRSAGRVNGSAARWVPSLFSTMLSDDKNVE
jgi:hypothetical protein